MRRVCCFLIMLVLLGADLVGADQPPRRTTRVASGPVRPARKEEPQTATPAPKPVVSPSVTRPAPARPALLEPSFQLEGVGRGMVACFQVEAQQAAIWQLVVREVDGPVAQIFEGQGPPPTRIPWDGRLLDGGLAWSGVTYTYDLAFIDSTDAVSEMPGNDFTLPAYSREDREGISFLMPGRRLAPGRRGDPVPAATAALESVAQRLNADAGLAPVRVEVLARDETAAMALGETVRAALAGLLDPADRAVDLYVGTASAVPSEGTVLITTVPLALPAS